MGTPSDSGKWERVNPEVRKRIKSFLKCRTPIELVLKEGEVVSGYLCGLGQVQGKPPIAIIYRGHLPNRNVPLPAIKDVRVLKAP